MKNILLVLSPSDTLEEAIDFAVARAKKNGARLIALYLIEAGLAEEVFDTFTDIGFIGEKPSAQVSESIMKDHRQRGYEELGRVQIKTMEAGVDFEPLLEQGELASRALELINRNNIGLAVLVRKKSGKLLKYFSRSAVDEVKEQARCEVRIFEE